MSISSKSIPIRRHDELEDIRSDAHHEVVTHADVSGAVHAHDDLVNPHPLAKNIGGRGFGLGDGNLAVLPTATEGQVLLRGATAWEAGDLAGILPPAGGDFILVSEVNVTSPVTSVLFDGLNINLDGNYALFLEATHNLNANVWYSVFINEDTNSSNYRMQRVSFNAANVQAARFNFSGILRVETIDRTGYSTARMALVNNKFHCIAEATLGEPANYRLYSFGVRYMYSQTNVTRLRISANNTNGIGIGSRIRLYRL